MFFSSCCQASLGAEKALDDLLQANEMLRVDIEKWGDSKDREVCSLMNEVAKDHITYHQKVSPVCVFNAHPLTDSLSRPYIQL